MNAIITAPTIMSMFMNLTTDVENNKFCYNAEMEDNRISAIEVYKNNDNVLSAHIKRIYTYDELDRLSYSDELKSFYLELLFPLVLQLLQIRRIL